MFTLLDRTARGMRKAGDERPLDTLMADLFVEYLTGTALIDAEPGAAPPPTSWHTVDGLEPWTESDPPPADADTEADTEADPAPDDPAPDDPAWDQPVPESRPPTAPDQQDQPGDTEPPARRLPLAVEVQVVISAATLLGIDDAPGMLRGYGAVPASVIRDIVAAADAGSARTRLRALFCDPVDGRLVAMDSTARCFVGGLRQFAVCRDHDSRLGGGRIVDVDHIVDHHAGGPTSAGNAQSLGKLPHVLKDHPAITVQALAPASRGDGLDQLRIHTPGIGWRLPSGRTHTSRPPPALGLGSGPDPPPHPNPDSAGEQHLARLHASLN